MKRWDKENRMKWRVIGVGFLAAGMFLTGIGFQRYLSNRTIRKSYENSDQIWKQELAQGMEQEARDTRNRELIRNMEYVSMESEVYFETAEAPGTARIANGAASIFGCTVTLFRDATGEEIYRSEMIEPGHYIEYIRINSGLKQGYYPCTAIWNFYTGEDEYVGETAGKVVLVIKN